MHKYRSGKTTTGTGFFILAIVMSQSLSAQPAGLADPRPIPRLENGQISFQVPPGELGVWNRGDYRPIIPETPEQVALRNRGRNRDDPSGLKPNFSDVPFQPWAEELYMWRQEHEIEPYGRCKPTGGFRNMAVPYGTDIVQVPDEQRMYIFQTGGSHTFRTIYLDGRPHPEDLDPSYGGHSVGRWEGDTLIIDTVGINERGWIDAYGAPTTKLLHLTERIERLDFGTFSYEMIIDDPGAYTDTWSTGMLMRWTPERESFQFLCQDNNLAGELMVGEGSSGMDRTSSITP
jgi:hypothetical protein